MSPDSPSGLPDAMRRSYAARLGVALAFAAVGTDEASGRPSQAGPTRTLPPPTDTDRCTCVPVWADPPVGDTRN